VKWEAPFGGSVDAVGVVPRPVREGLSPPRGALRVTAGVRSLGSKPKRVVPSGGRGRGEDRREAVSLSGFGVAASHLGVMGERE
jgi:hypothetical protein